MATHIADSVLSDYLTAPPGSAAKEGAARIIADAVAGTIRAAIADHGTVVALAADGTREELVADATMAVLSMVAHYDPSRGVPFAAWVSSPAAPWRRVLAERVMAARYGGRRNRADMRVLAAYDAAVRKYEETYGQRPPTHRCYELLAAAVAERAAAAGETAEEADKRNTRSGFKAAGRRLPNLLDTSTLYSLDDAGDTDTDLYATLPAPEDARLAEFEASDTVAAWQRLAGGDACAAQRMQCPHAQWLHLAPAAALTVSPPLP